MTADKMLCFQDRFWGHAGFQPFLADNIPNCAGYKEFFNVLFILLHDVVQHRETDLAAYLSVLYTCLNKIGCFLMWESMRLTSLSNGILFIETIFSCTIT